MLRLRLFRLDWYMSDCRNGVFLTGPEVQAKRLIHCESLNMKVLIGGQWLWLEMH